MVPFIFMFVSNIFWAFHDLHLERYRIGLVERLGWHVIKFIMLAFFSASLILAGVKMCSMSWESIALFSVALLFAKQAGFEGTYNIVKAKIRPFEWFRYARTAITGVPFKGIPSAHLTHLKNSNRFEFWLHHCFRIHWSEALSLLLVGIWIMLRIR